MFDLSSFKKRVFFIKTEIIRRYMGTTFQQKLIQIVYGDNFFTDYAGRLITDPKVALIELVANSWDASSQQVKIKWPEEPGGYFEIVDDGEGMTSDEFSHRWNTLNYNRKTSQGLTTQMPGTKKTRRVYGRNGKGRHSLFCFSDSYKVETCKNGTKSIFEITHLKSQKDPYEVKQIGENPTDRHGTKISTKIVNNYLPVTEVTNLLGSKFVVDPSFDIFVNDQKIKREDFIKNADSQPYYIDGEGEVLIHIIDSQKVGRISWHHGVAYWVNKRLVGEHSWKSFANTYLDQRYRAAKRYSIIVEADILEDEVLPDWTWFRDTPKANKIIDAINLFILDTVHKLMSDVRIESKRNALQLNRNKLRNLGEFGRVRVGNVVEQIQMSCPAIQQRYLADIIDIVINLELTTTGYKLLQQLADTPPEDLDTLSKILDEWTITEAKIVLDELGRRLKIISKMEKLVENPSSDELHELQPLFEKGLWIFGPEYEGVKYLGNKQISTIIRDFFKIEPKIKSEKRPDVVALPDSIIESFSCDNFEDGEPFGILKILILELKRGGIDITTEVRRQAEDYAELIRESGRCDNNTKILCYVLGTSVRCGDHNDERKNIEVVPMSFMTVLRKAKARTFNLMERIKESKKISAEIDPVVQEVLEQAELEI